MYNNCTEEVTEASISAWACEAKIRFSDELGMTLCVV